MIPSSSEEFARAMHGQPKRLSRNCPGRNVGNVIVDILISFHSRIVFSALRRLFVRPGFRSFCALLAVYSVIRSLIEKTLPATARGTMAAVHKRLQNKVK